MRIHYDNIVFSLQRAGGISTYWAELITRLQRDQIDVTFEEFKHQNIVRNTFLINESALRTRGSRYLLVERFKALKLPEQNLPFVFHSSYNRITNNRNAAQVTTVHDFVHEKFYKGIRRSLHLMQKGKVLRAAKQIITVSENTKRDLMHFHPAIPETNIRVIYNGVSEDFYPLDEIQKVALSEAGKRPYLLYIGSREHYKNFKFTVDLLKEVADFDLYIIGSALLRTESQYLMQQVPGRWKHFDHINNQRLNELYNSAYGLIYPSLYEGFGIPLLEAMKAGVPFLALNNSAIPEVAGDAGILLEHADIDLFKDALHNLSSNRFGLIERGYVQAAKFSWEKCYQETLSVYKELANQ